MNRLGPGGSALACRCLIGIHACLGRIGAGGIGSPVGLPLIQPAATGTGDEAFGTARQQIREIPVSPGGTSNAQFN